VGLCSVKATTSITSLFAAVSMLWSPTAGGCDLRVYVTSVGKQRLSKVEVIPEIQQTSFPKRFSSVFVGHLLE